MNEDGVGQIAIKQGQARAISLKDSSNNIATYSTLTNKLASLTSTLTMATATSTMRMLSELTPDQMRQILSTLYERSPDVVVAVTADVMETPYITYPAEPSAAVLPNAESDSTTAATTAADPSNDVTNTADTDADADATEEDVAAGAFACPGSPGAVPGSGNMNRGRPSTISWETRFSELALYKAQKGTCKVTLTNNASLHRWVASQRKQYRNFATEESSQLSQDKIDQLLSIGFEFVTERQQAIQNKQHQQRHYSWDEWLARLQEYKNNNGHANVPQKDDSGLGLWVAKQRQTHKLYQAGKPSPMTPERAAALDEIGFIFQSQAPKTPWKTRFQALEAYKLQEGNTRVPVRGRKNNGDETTYSQLGKWVEHQRTQHKLKTERKQSAMTDERIVLLEGLGFEWIIPKTPKTPGCESKKRTAALESSERKFDSETGSATPSSAKKVKKIRQGDRSVQTKKWTEKLDELKNYAAQNGHCRVAAGKGKSYSKLGKWVEHQRTQFRMVKEGKNSSMTPERITQLEELRFEFAILPGQKEDEGTILTTPTSGPANVAEPLTTSQKAFI